MQHDLPSVRTDAKQAGDRKNVAMWPQSSKKAAEEPHGDMKSMNIPASWSPEGKEPGPGAGFVASAVLHVLLCLIALFLQPARPLDRPKEQVVTVQMVPAPRPHQQESGTLAPLSTPPRPQPPTPARTVAKPSDDDMIRPDHLYSGRMLADPRSAPARRKMATFAPDERVVQLCNLEALEQVHRWKASLDPDLLSPYATADLKQSGHSIEADGGAFRAGNHWFAIRFTCRVADDYGSVAAFAFKVGDEIPREKWAAHDLLPDDGDDDDD